MAIYTESIKFWKKWAYTYILSYITLLIYIVSDYTASNTLAYRETKLLDKLLDNYDKRVIPQRNASHAVSMSLGLHLLNLVELVRIAWTCIMQSF